MLEILLVAALAINDSRYCYEVHEVPRTEEGRILRSRTAVAEFRAAHPCPVTGKTTGACPGWAVDHVIPLACGGCDATHNLQWLPATIKSCAGKQCKDRWERIIYCPK